ncbi:MAG: extracellular solute-binding protein [bacterium]|nr:extracellular solute-binding protein [bacterium]
MTSRVSSLTGILSATLLLSIALVLTGCPSKRSGDPNDVIVIKNTWHKIDTPPGADPLVADSLGGNGFEAKAASMGFETYTFAEEDKKVFEVEGVKTGGQFTYIESQFPATFRPVGQSSSFTQVNDVASLVYEALIVQHPITLAYAPGLATHWKISADKKVFTFRIDPRARFSDGSPVTARDVVATWKLMMDESIGEPSSQLVYSKFEEPVALSKYLLEVKCKTVNFRNLLYFGTSLIIMPEKQIGSITGKEFIEKYNTEMPMGTGEYILLESDIKSGQSYTLTRRDDYWAKDDLMNKSTGNFDKITINVVKDNPTLEYEKFKAGEADILRFNMNSTENWVNDTAYLGIKNSWVLRKRIYTDGPMGTQGITFNMRKPPFDDIRVRKAFILLFNRQQQIEKLLYNEYEPYDTYYPNTVFSNPKNPVMKYDPTTAQRLLAEAGWSSRNSDGLLVKNGKPFVLEIAIQKTLERFLTPYQEDLRKAGIDLKIKYMDWNAVIKNIDERNFQIFAFGYGGLITPNPETSLNSELADKNDNNNIQGFKNPRVDQLCDEYDSTFNIERQIEIIREIDGLAYDVYMTGFWWNPRGMRVAHWNKFGMPEYGLPRYGQLGYVQRTAASYWWYEPAKASALVEAKKNNTKLADPSAIQTLRFWKDYSSAAGK